jgi:hypothetical protein
LNSKRPDGDSVKETSPLSKFLGICTTIQGHDLFIIPINKTVGAPLSFTKPLAFKPLPTQACFSPSAQLQEPMAGGSNRRRAADEAEGSRADERRRQ